MNASAIAGRKKWGGGATGINNFRRNKKTDVNDVIRWMKLHNGALQKGGKC